MFIVLDMQRPAEDAEVEVLNEVGARIGDRILIDIKTSAFLKATFLLYVFPIIGLTAGAMLGGQFADYYAYDASACSAAFGFGAFFSDGGRCAHRGQPYGTRAGLPPPDRQSAGAHGTCEGQFAGPLSCLRP